MLKTCWKHLKFLKKIQLFFSSLYQKRVIVREYKKCTIFWEIKMKLQFFFKSKNTSITCGNVSTSGVVWKVFNEITETLLNCLETMCGNVSTLCVAFIGKTETKHNYNTKNITHNYELIFYNNYKGFNFLSN